VRNQGVHFLLGILFIVTEAGKFDTNTERNVVNTLAPNVLVQRGIDADILGAQSGLGKLLDLTNSAGGFSLEGNLVQSLVEIDRVFASHDRVLVGLFLLASGCYKCC